MVLGNVVSSEEKRRVKGEREGREKGGEGCIARREGEGDEACTEEGWRRMYRITLSRDTRLSPIYLIT